MVDNKKTLIFSLGGSLIIPKDRVRVEFLKKFKVFILRLAKKYRLVIITGGGGINRHYNKSAKKISQIKNVDLDWLGIAASKLNGELIRTIFSQKASFPVIDNPYTKIRMNKKLIIASGWRPGCSTDKDAVLWAKNLKTKEIINLSNIDYVYDKDPYKYKNAKPIKEINWENFLKIVGTKWSPRISAPFDPVASKLAKEMGLKVVILNGNNLKNIEKYLNSKKFIGTIIKS